MNELIKKALKGYEYEIIEDAKIVTTVKIHSDSFHFGRIETFKYHGLSLDNFFRKENGDIYIIVSKVIGFPEINSCFILSAQIDFDKSDEEGFQTIVVTALNEDQGGQFIIPNYRSNDYNIQDIIGTILEQIVISRHEEKMNEILREFNPFTAKGLGLNPKSAQLYIKELKQTSKQNYQQLCHMFKEEVVERWLEDQHLRMNFIEEIESIRKEN